jgi:uncharacterized membrane protein YesL
VSDALRVAWRAIRDAYDELFLLAGVNTLALLLCIPLITLPPALAGAAFVTYRAAHGVGFFPRDFWTGFRQYFWLSWKLALPSLIGWLLLIINLQFYANQTNPYLRLIVILWAYVAFVWLALQFYLFPLLVYQKDKSVKALFKNAAILAISKPLFNLALLIVVILIATMMVLSGVVAALLLIVFVSLTASVALRFLLEPGEWDKRGFDEEEDERPKHKRR